MHQTPLLINFAPDPSKEGERLGKCCFFPTDPHQFYFARVSLRRGHALNPDGHSVSATCSRQSQPQHAPSTSANRFFTLPRNLHGCGPSRPHPSSMMKWRDHLPHVLNDSLGIFEYAAIQRIGPSEITLMTLAPGPSFPSIHVFLASARRRQESFFL